MNVRSDPVWLFDLDNTLHNASHSALPGMTAAMGEFIQRELGLDKAASDALRRRYFLRYGATMGSRRLTFSRTRIACPAWSSASTATRTTWRRCARCRGESTS